MGESNKSQNFSHSKDLSFAVAVQLKYNIVNYGMRNDHIQCPFLTNYKSKKAYELAQAMIVI